MAAFSFDLVSEYDKAEMNNTVTQAQREIATRYDFKGTTAQLDWLDDKKGLRITGDNQYHLEAIADIVRKKLASRNLSQKVLDTSKEPVSANLKMTWDIPFKAGLDQDKARQLSKVIRDKFPKAKPQVQGEAVRVMSTSKDELQAVMAYLRIQDLDYPVQFNNFR